MSTKIYHAYEWHGDLLALHRLLLRLRSKRLTVHSQGYESAEDAYLELIRSGANQDAIREVTDSAVIYTHPDDSDRLFVQFFMGHVQPPKHRLLKDFHYQNQTDPPEDVPKREWEARQRTWDRIFKHTDIPGEAGFAFELSTPRMVWTHLLRKQNSR